MEKEQQSTKQASGWEDRQLPERGGKWRTVWDCGRRLPRRWSAHNGRDPSPTPICLSLSLKFAIGAEKHSEKEKNRRQCWYTYVSVCSYFLRFVVFRFILHALPYTVRIRIVYDSVHSSYMVFSVFRTRFVLYTLPYTCFIVNSLRSYIHFVS